MNQWESVASAKTILRRNRMVFLFSIIAFCALFVFYTKVHPMYIFDLDDWLYISYGRHAFPTTALWNPTKVMPETLFPLTSYIAVYLLYPLTGDYIMSLCYVHAFVTVTFILGYILMAGRVLKRRFGLNDGVLAVFLTIFLLAHFTPFLVKDRGNYHLFNSMNVNCFFNYMIPALWNYTLCFFFMSTKESVWYEKSGGLKKGLLVFGVYLAINSNLWTSVILMCYFGVEILFDLIESIHERRQGREKAGAFQFLRQFVITQFPRLFAIGCWFVSLLFEFRSRRGAGFISGSLQLAESMEEWITAVTSMNRTFWKVVLVINFAALAVACFRHWKGRASGENFLGWQLKMVVCLGLCAVYQVLLGSVVGASYVSRNDTLMCWMLWLLMMTASSLAYLYQRFPRTQWAMPLLVFVLLVEVVLSPTTFVGNYASAETPSQVKAINEDIIRQVKEAEAAGESRAEVHLPETVSWGWPLDEQLSPSRISWSLYSHGITEKQIKITIVPDPEKDIEFNLR